MELLGTKCLTPVRNRLKEGKEDERARLSCRRRKRCPRLPAEGGSTLSPGLAHPSLHVKGGWDAKNVARPEADAPRYRSDLKRLGSACGIPIEQKRSKWQCWLAGAWLSPRGSIPELASEQSRPSQQSTQPPGPRRSPLSRVSAQAILRDFRTKHISPPKSSARERPAACRQTHPSCPLLRGASAAALLPKSGSLLPGWRVAECSYEDAFGTDSEPGAEDLGARRSPTLVAQM